MKVGILALQGAFAAHEEMLQSLGANTVQVRTTEDLKLVDALVMPGGESTTMSHLLSTSQLFDPIAERIKDAMPVFGTCAGMILLAKSIADGRPDQRFYGAIDIDIQRNAYGRQVESFETSLIFRTNDNGKIKDHKVDTGRRLNANGLFKNQLERVLENKMKNKLQASNKTQAALPVSQ